jgi:hypothetical protein
METAAAILTKLAFEQNDRLKSQLNGFHVQSGESVAEVILPYFRHILATLEKKRGASDAAPPGH